MSGSRARLVPGILWSIGEQIGGMVLYVEEGSLRFYYNGFGEHSTLPAVHWQRRL